MRKKFHIFYAIGFMYLTQSQAFGKWQTSRLDNGIAVLGNLFVMGGQLDPL